MYCFKIKAYVINLQKKVMYNHIFWKCLPFNRIILIYLQLAAVCEKGKVCSICVICIHYNLSHNVVLWKKGRDLIKSHDKNPYTNRTATKIKQWPKMSPKRSITQRLRTDMVRSVHETTVMKKVWLTNLLVYPSNPRISCVIKLLIKSLKNNFHKQRGN